MNNNDWKPKAVLDSCIKKIRSILSQMFSPALFVGNKDRVRKPGEEDGDEKHLADLNKTWRDMLHDDPWQKKLMTHVSLLTTAMGMFFVMFWFSGLFLPAKHPIFGYICGGIAFTIPYWLWVGNWHNKIQKKVFEAFKKRFGKHYHLK